MNIYSPFGNFYHETYEDFLRRKKMTFSKNGYYDFINDLSQDSKPEAGSTEPSSLPQQSIVPKNQASNNTESSNKHQALTLDDLKTYHRLFIKFIGLQPYNIEEKLNTLNLKDLPLQKDKSDLRLFKYIHGKVLDEQKKYASLAERLSREKFTTVSYFFSELLDYMEELSSTRKRIAMDLYPRFYVCLDVISSFIPTSPTKRTNYMSFKFLELKHRSGVSPSIVLPPLDAKNKRSTLSEVSRSVKKTFPCEADSKMLWKLSPLIKDALAMDLAVNSCCDFLASPKCLLTLLNNMTDLSHRWDIPVIIKEHNGSKLIILDKPLPNPQDTDRQKNYQFSKLCCRILFESNPGGDDEPQDSNPFSTEKKDNASPVKLCKELEELKKSIEESPKFNILDSSHESERVFTRSQRKRQSSLIDFDEQNEKDNQAESEDDNDDEQLQIDMTSSIVQSTEKSQPSIICSPRPIVYKKICIPEEIVDIGEPASPTNDSAAEVDMTPKIIPLDASDETPTNDVTSPNMSQVKKPDNVSECKTEIPGENGLGRNYAVCELFDKKLMIRYRDHGRLDNPTSESHQSVYLQLKPEYQDKYGCECLSWREVWQAWLALNIRDNATLIRVRCSAKNGDLLLYEEEKLEDLLKKYFTFKPHPAFRFLNHLLTKFQCLPVGHYLVRHRSLDNDCQVFQATPLQDKRPANSMDLRHEYLFTKNNPIQSEWLPVDTRLFHVNHLANESVPALFEPRPINSSSAVNNQQNSSHSKKYKSKRKKRKSYENKTIKT